MKQLFSILIILIITSISQADNGGLLKKLEVETDQKITRSLVDVLFLIKNRHRDQKLTNGSFLMYSPSVSKEEWVDIKNKFIKSNVSQGAIDIYKGKFSSETFGSGFLYKGYIITNFHVCRGKNSMARDYEGKVIALKVIDFDMAQDICLLKSDFATSNYQDFSQIDKSRNVASVPTKKKDLYKIHSMFGVIEAFDLVPDTKKDDAFTKSNGYVLTNYNKECRGGISGSAVEGPNGFFGIVWGATEYEPFVKQSDCFLIEKKTIDDMIARNN